MTDGVQSLIQPSKLRRSQFTVFQELAWAIQFDLVKNKLIYNLPLMAKSGFKGYTIWVTYFHFCPISSCLSSLKEKSFKVRISGFRLTSRGHALREKGL